MNRPAVILIVDDEAIGRRAVESALADQGYEILGAGSGAEAIAIALRRAPDLILLDVMMPGMDGLEVVRRIRAESQLAEVPIILLTALDERALRLAGIEAGADDFVSKPFDRAELRARARTVTRLNRYQRLREQAALLDLSPDAIIVTDLNDRVTFWSRGAEQLYGWPAAAALGQPLQALVGVARRGSDPALPPLIPPDSGWGGELQRKTQGGREVTVLGRRTLVPDHGGSPCSVLVIDTDITQRKQLEASLFRAQQAETIGVLAGGVAHDLNNLLIPILEALDSLPVPTDDPEQTELLHSAQSCAKQGVTLVRQLLGLAQGAQDARVATDLCALARKGLGILKTSIPTSIELTLDVPPCPAFSVVNPTQVQQVLMNLCLNARDAIPDRGQVTVGVHQIQLAATDLPPRGEALPGDFIAMTVRDTGDGIAAEHLGQMFEPLFTTKPNGKGSGLGLYTSRRIVEGHGGFMTVESQPGEGTCFTAYWPAAGVGA